MRKSLKNWFWIGGGGPSYSAGYQAILDRATALGSGYEHPTTATKALQNQLYIDLDALGLTTLFDVARVYAHDGGSKFGLINWVNPNTHLATMPAGDLTFTSKKGYTSGNGSKYIDDNYNPSTEGVKFTADNASISYYKIDPQTINTINGNIQSVSGTTKIQAFRFTAATAFYFVNNVGFSASVALDFDGDGLLTCSLNMADAPDVAALVDGTLISSTNVGARTIADSLRNCWYGSDKSAFVAYGADIRSTHASFNTLLANYIAAL